MGYIAGDMGYSTCDRGRFLVPCSRLRSTLCRKQLAPAHKNVRIESIQTGIVVSRWLNKTILLDHYLACSKKSLRESVIVLLNCSR